MQELLQLNHVNDYANDIGAPVYHPHVNVIHYDEMGPIRHTLNRFGVYGIFMQDNFPDNLSYGVGTYEIADGSLLAYAPGQIGGKPDNGHLEVYHGWVLMFDAEFMRGTEFERNLKHYRYFSYSSNEALILTHDERRTLDSIMEIIRNELSASDRNEFAEKIVKDYILLVADYCNKFYQRQFKHSAQTSSDVLSRLDDMLNHYYENDLQERHGVPTVKYCASQLCLSPGYFGDIIRNVTGRSANHYIKSFLMERAKSLLMSGKTVTQVADALGFEYPQHFTRVFKNMTGALPSAYLKGK